MVCLIEKKLDVMDPQRKSFQLCELASCTDLPVFEDVPQELFLPAKKPPSSGDDDYESLETSSNCSYDSRFSFDKSLSGILHNFAFYFLDSQHFCFSHLVIITPQTSP